jgi:hypothetical protein
MKKIIFILLTSSVLISCNLVSSPAKVNSRQEQEKKWRPKKANRTSQETLKITGKVKPKKVRIESATETKKVKVQDPYLNKVEVSWVVPKINVDGFILNYGFSETVQDKKVKIFVKDLKRAKDEKHGEVYKYILNEVPKEKDVFVRISAFLGEEVSEPSDVMKVKK